MLCFLHFINFYSLTFLHYFYMLQVRYDDNFYRKMFTVPENKVYISSVFKCLLCLRAGYYQADPSLRCCGGSCVLPFRRQTCC